MANWFSRLFSRQRLERDLDRELRFHVDQERERLIRDGVAPEEARRRALASFGGLDPIKESTRDARGTRWLEHLGQDWRYALRMMRRSPGFTLAAVGSLAIGIGANAAIFSVTDALLLRSLPVTRPEELNFINRAGYAQPNMRFSGPDLTAIRAAAPDAHFAAMGSANTVQLVVDTNARLAVGQLVTGDWFDLLGVTAQAGRMLQSSDSAQLGASPVAVISDSLWTRAFGRDAGIVGKSVTVNRVPMTIVGIAQEGFSGLTVGSRIDMWMPVTMQFDLHLFGNASIDNADGRKPWMPQEGIRWLTVIGRIAAPANPAGVLPRLRGAHQQWMQTLMADINDPARRANFGREHLEFVPAGQGLSPLRDTFSTSLGVLMGTVAIVLLIACANLASLVLARSSTRTREFALRVSLGAGRWRVVRQLLTETGALALLGGIAGLAIARWGALALLRMASTSSVPVPLALPLDWRFIGFTTGITFAAAALVGLVPALRSSRIAPVTALKTGGRAVGGSGSLPFGKFLVVGQMALSLALLVGALLFLRTFRNLVSVDAGFDADRVVTARFDPRLAGFSEDQLPGLYDRLLTQAAALPGAGRVALAFSGPVTGSQRISNIRVEGRPPLPGDGNDVREDYVTPGFFATIGTTFTAGRDFTDADGPKSPKVAVVNEAMARHFFGSDPALGRRFGYGQPYDTEIIGIIKDMKVDGFRDDVPAMIYYPVKQNPSEFLRNLYVHTTLASVESIESQLTRAVQAADRNLAVREVTTLADLAGRTVSRERLLSNLTATFGLLAVLVACLGLYGTISYSVARRTNEIGVRLALGATPSGVSWTVLRETLALVAIGGVIGVALSAGTLQFVKTLLYGLSPRDPQTIAMAGLGLFAVGLLAGLLPAWRASRVDPLTALRSD